MHRIHISIATSHAHGNYDNTPTEFNVALVGNAPDLPLEEFHQVEVLAGGGERQAPVDGVPVQRVGLVGER